MPQIPNRDNRMPLIKAEHTQEFLREVNKNKMTEEHKKRCEKAAKLSIKKKSAVH